MNGKRRHSHCLECGRSQAQEWKQRNPGPVLEANLCRYNLTLEQYECMLESQGFACALCKRPVQELVRRLDVDHDHQCCLGYKSCGKCIRGLLCNSCNQMVGKLERLGLAAVAVYLG